MSIPVWKEQLLNLTYTLAVWGRTIQRAITRPTEMGVRVLVLRDDNVLLVRHRGGAWPWSLPGGGVKARETLDAAVHREVHEEAGCTVRIERLHGIFHNFKQGFNNYIAVFVCTPLDDLRPPVGDLEIATACFVPLHTLPATTDAGSRQRVTEYLRGGSNLVGEW